MLLRESKSHGDFMNGFPSPIKSPSYMPPIKQFDKQFKPFYSPSGPSHSRKLSSHYSENPSPRRELAQSRLKVLNYVLI